MSPLTIGFIGVGGIATIHGKGMLARPDLFRFQAVADINKKAWDQFADEFGIPDRYEDFTRVLADRRIDAVVILLPYFLHEQACVAAFVRSGETGQPVHLPLR